MDNRRDFRKGANDGRALSVRVPTGYAGRAKKSASLEENLPEPAACQGFHQSFRHVADSGVLAQAVSLPLSNGALPE